MNEKLYLLLKTQNNYNLDLPKGYSLLGIKIYNTKKVTGKRQLLYQEQMIFCSLH